MSSRTYHRGMTDIQITCAGSAVFDVLAKTQGPLPIGVLGLVDTFSTAEGGPALADPLGGAERARAGPESWLTFCAPPGSASAMGESALLL